MEDIVKGLSLILEFENIILILGGVLIGVLVGCLLYTSDAADEV